MDIFLKVISISIVGLITWVTLSKQNKEIATLLSVFICCLVFIGSIQYFQPILSFIEKLEYFGKIDHTLVSTLMKAVGVGLLSEVICLLCKDIGIASVGKSIQFISSAVIIWLSIPLLNELIELVDDILGAL